MCLVTTNEDWRLTKIHAMDRYRSIQLSICANGQLRDIFTEGLRVKSLKRVVGSITSIDPWLTMCLVTTNKDWRLTKIHVMDQYKSIQLKICANRHLRDVFTKGLRVKALKQVVRTIASIDP